MTILKLEEMLFGKVVFVFTQLLIYYWAINLLLISSCRKLKSLARSGLSEVVEECSNSEMVEVVSQ
jgi:hypothetical protein